MKLWANLRDAAQGWNMILRGLPGWEAGFRLTSPGIVTALALFYLFAFLVLMLSAFQVTVSIEGFVSVMLVQSLWLLALLAAIYATRQAVRSPVPVTPLFVPGVYALIAYLVAGSLVSLLFGPLLPLLWLALVFMLFRLGRAAGQWTTGVSLAFAFLTVVLLVALPMTFYIVMAPATFA